VKSSGKLRTAACALALFALNAYITLFLFHTDYTRQMGSIEAAYIGLARYLAKHLGQLSWFPLWYGGIPYADTYPPLLHMLCGLLVAASGISPGLAHHFVTATVYALGPVTLFWMAWRLGGNRASALAAAVGYSLISPACLLVKEVRFDAGGLFAGRRLDTLIVYGEGPHLTALCLLPLAIGLLHVALTKRRPWYYVLAALGIAAVPLSNWLGAMALAFSIAAYLLSGFHTRWPAAWVRTAGLGVYAYAVALPWMSPATIAVIRANAPRVANNFESNSGQRIYLAVAGAGFLLAAWALARARVAPATRFALLVSCLFGITALGRYWFHLSLVPQPERYHLEMDMAFWLALAFLAWPWMARIPWRAAWGLGIAAALACVPIVVHQRRAALEMGKPIDIRTTVEYKTAKWLDARMPGQRVFAPGTIGFWLNAFSDAPQLTGGFDNGIVNPFVPHVIYQIYAGDKQQIGLDFLKAYGCDAVVGGGKDSAEVYHPYAHPEKFAGLTELRREGGDVIYDVPRRSRSLAHAMRLADQVQLTPVAYDTTAIQPYLAALDNPAYPAADFRWRAPDDAVIAADLKPDHILSVQITWDKGWKAYAGGRRVPAWGDKLGQMVVEPRCSGPCTVELKYDGGTEGIFARAIQRLALAGGALWILVAILWRMRSGLTKTN
jgi:hypothetical protein